MLGTMNKIYTILILIKNLLFRKKRYILHFVAEVDPPIKRWYYDFKHWGFNHSNLEMVSGADALCEKYSKGENDVVVEVVASKHLLDEHEGDLYVAETPSENMSLWDKISLGRNYTNIETGKDGKLIITKMWICPVTLFVIGRYPKYLYISRYE